LRAPRHRMSCGEALWRLLCIHRGRRRLLALPFAKHDHPVRRLAGKRLLPSIWPYYLDGVNPFGRTQAKMGTRIVAAQVTVTRIEPAPPLPAAGAHGDLSTVGIATAQGRIDGPHEQEM